MYILLYLMYVVHSKYVILKYNITYNIKYILNSNINIRKILKNNHLMEKYLKVDLVLLYLVLIILIMMVIMILLLVHHMKKELVQYISLMAIVMDYLDIIVKE